MFGSDQLTLVRFCGCLNDQHTELIVGNVPLTGPGFNLKTRSRINKGWNVDIELE